MDRQAICRALRRNKTSLRKDFKVRRLAMFGSYARGTAKERSDLDLLVDFDDPPGLLGFIDLEQRLSRITGVRVDLVMSSAIKPAIADDVLRDRFPIW